MSTPSRIAIVGAGVMVATILVTNLVVQLAAQEFGLVSFAQLIASATPEALGIGFLAGIGIYFGSRRVALDQRNGQFMKLVATAYGAPTFFQLLQ